MDIPMRLFICLNLLWILSFSAVACLIASIATKNWLVNEKEDLHIGLYNFCTETRCVIKNVFREPYYLGVFRLGTVQRCFFVSILCPVIALGGLIIAVCRRKVNLEFFSFIGILKIMASLCMVIAMSVFTKDYRDGKIKYYNYKDTTSIDDFKLGWSFDLGWLGCILLTVDLFITCVLGYIYWRSSFQNNAGEKTGLGDGL